MEKLTLQLHSSQAALGRLQEGLQQPVSEIIRDACIHRFEFSFEILWKLLMTYLKEREGIVCRSPKECFRAALSVGLASEEATRQFLKMVDDRNLTSHTYIEAVAASIFQRLPEYSRLMDELLSALSNRSIEDGV